MADPWVRPTSPGPPDPGIVFRPESDQRPASGKTYSPDDYLLIDRLREDAASGRMDLDSILSEATHAARYFTDATGAALALWSQGVVICRARSGDTAPPLGAKLDVDSGISGECLRSGRAKRCNDTLMDPLVDSTVCQELGIRSLAAVPLRGEHGVVGILEIFSDRPYAFTDAHLTLLKQLAQIAVTGRSKSAPSTTAVVKTASDVVPVSTAVEPRIPKLSAPLMSSFQSLTAKMKGEEGQPYRMAAAGAVLLALIVGFGWIISRGRSSNSGNRAPRSVQAASAVTSAMAATPDTVITVTPTTTSGKAGHELLKIGLPKPNAESSNKDAVAGDLVRRASTEEVTSRGTAAAGATNSTAPGSGGTVAPTTPEDVQAPDLNTVVSADTQSTPGIPQNLLASQPRLPTNELRTSQGVTGGALTHRVSPTYPSQARIQRIEGTVVLQALVAEDGNVRDVKVSSGPAVLSAAAKQAVEQWRYQPFQLNGKPVAMTTSIKIVFKLP
jgi:TonB family protein